MAATEEFRPDLLAPLLRDLSAAGRSAELPVRGNSMRPLLRDGDRVRVIPVTATNVRVGEVVVSAEATGPIIHRVVGWWPSRHGWRVLTKGDNASRLDAPLLVDGLVGRAVARVRGSHVRRLDDLGMRFRGRSRALVSLAAGLAVEMWDRAHRRAGSRRA
jgi:signal peptidase I